MLSLQRDHIKVSNQLPYRLPMKIIAETSGYFCLIDANQSRIIF